MAVAFGGGGEGAGIELRELPRSVEYLFKGKERTHLVSKNGVYLGRFLLYDEEAGLYFLGVGKESVPFPKHKIADGKSLTDDELEEVGRGIESFVKLFGGLVN